MTDLSTTELAMLEGSLGDGVALAMRILVRMARLGNTSHLIEITSAHVDGCLYHGRAGLDFAERLLAGGARVSVPTTLNVSSLDLLHPELYRGDEETAFLARRLMDAYVGMGASPTWTCAPYQLMTRPGLGEQIAWAESNAIVFANSVLGARTDRYGDFMDICAAITGRVPAAGLHLAENRGADVEVVVEIDIWRDSDYAVLGHLIGDRFPDRIPVISGMETATEDQLKMLGAAAASSGATAMFHVVGITPEAATLEAATGGKTVPIVRLGRAEFDQGFAELSTTTGTGLDAVCLGTPHASTRELHRIRQLLAGRAVRIPMYVSTSRDTLGAIGAVADDLAASGVMIVTDTCTYVTPILDGNVEVVMTDSAKWAYYAPGNLGVAVAFGSMAECVESACAGRIVRD